MSSKKIDISLYTKNQKVWLPSQSNVWVCAILTKDYEESDKVINYEIIPDDIFDRSRRRSDDTECSEQDKQEIQAYLRETKYKDQHQKAGRMSSNDSDKSSMEVGSTGTYSLPDGKNSLPFLRNPDILLGQNDLTNLSYLHEPAVLYNLRKRFVDQEEIYTYCGIVLVAINPYKQLNIYTEEYMHTYAGRTLGENDPHIFAIAEESYRQMKNLNRNQSIIVTGESGAGKTVSAKYAMRYFATLGGGSSESQIEQKVLSSNPIMEAIGNAKTTRNDNSSRFGKYIEIEFNKKHAIIGASMRTYLLEKSRIIFQGEQERNYHIFYQLCAARDNPLLEDLNLSDPEDFKILYCGRCTEVDTINDNEDFNDVVHSFSLLGISSTFQSSFFRILGTILHLTNVEFERHGVEGSVIAPNKKNLAHLEDSCRLLGINYDQFKMFLCTKRIVTMAEVFNKPLSYDQAEASRDALCKFMYQKLFDHVVSKINNALHPGKHKTVNFIGVLDIYGFEWFKFNSFEQFCINYANEKLQQQFCKHVFKLEQEEYIKEQIEWKMIDYDDNQECITLIENKLGILDLLDECCRMPKGNDKEWALMLYNKHEKKSKHFIKPRTSQASFKIVHFADTVEYQCNGFVEKNRDTVSDDLLDLLRASEVDTICEIFAKSKEELAEAKPSATGARGGKRNKMQTVGGAFKKSLQQLMDTLESTTPHYVRCIKPNDTKSAFTIYNLRAIQQLRACGVLETIKISSAGYPSRWSYDEFFKRYRAMIKSTDIEWVKKPSKSNRGKVELRATCKNMLDIYIKDENLYQMGKTKIFFRAGQVAYMEKVRSDMMYRCAVIIQKTIRCYQARKNFITKRRAAKVIQRWVRGHQARQLAQHMRRENAATKIQTCFRRYQQEKIYQKQRQAIITMQSYARGMFARKLATSIRRENAAVLLQSYIRMYLVRQKYQKTLKAIVFCQSCIRRKYAKRELKRLKMQAKDVDHIKSLNKGLENKILQLQMKINTQNQEIQVLKKVEIEKDHLNQKLLAFSETEAIMKTKDVEIKDLNSKIAEFEEIVSQMNAAKEKQETLMTSEKDLNAERLNEILKLKEQQVLLNQEIEKCNLDFEKEKADLIVSAKEEASVELKKLTEEFEKLTTKHQKKCLDYDRLEQSYENLKRELHYTRQTASQESESHENLNEATSYSSISNHHRRDDSALATNTIIDEASENETVDDDLPAGMKPTEISGTVEVEADFKKAAGDNQETVLPRSRSRSVRTRAGSGASTSTVAAANTAKFEAEIKELTTKLKNNDKLIKDYKEEAEKLHSELTKLKSIPKPVVSSKHSMTDPMITEGLAEKMPSKPGDQAPDDFMNLEKGDLCEILAKTINCNRMLETDNEQIQSNYDYWVSWSMSQGRENFIWKFSACHGFELNFFYLTCQLTCVFMI